MSETVGGFGGRYARNKHHRRLVARALRERWAIPSEVRATLIERLAKIVQDSEATPRDVTAAGRAILAASKINLDHISVTIKARTHEEIERRLEEVERRVHESTSG
jgi:hypothetical protein